MCTAGVLLESDAAREISFPQSLPSGSAWPRTTQGDARHGCGRRATFRLRREAASARTRERGYSISAKRHGCSRQGERLLTGEFSPNAGRVAGPSVFSVEIHVRHASGRGYAPLPSATLLVNSPTGRSFDPSPSVHSPTWKNFNLRGHVLKRKIFLDVASPGQISFFTASRTRDRTGSPSFASPKRPCPIFHVRLFPSSPAAPLPHAHLGRTHALAPQHHRVK